MSAKRKKSSSKKTRQAAGISNRTSRLTTIVALLSFTSLLIAMFTISVIQYSDKAEVTPYFTYEESELSGWWTEGNVNFEEKYNLSKEDPSEQGEYLARLLFHQCPDGEPCNQDTSLKDNTCWAAFAYRTGDANVNDIIDNFTRERLSGGETEEYRVVITEESQFTSHHGIEDYTLQLLQGFNSEDSSYNEGRAIGLVHLPDGYIELQAKCKDYNHLDEVLELFDKVSLSTDSI